MIGIVSSLIAVIIGFILDLIFGDPYSLPHPVRFIGNLISFLERFLRGKIKSEYVSGVILSIIVITISTGIPLLILIVAQYISPYLRLVIESFMCYQILATASLKKESMKVYYSLDKGDLNEARKNLSMIVGRDVESLDEKNVAKAAVETVAENTSDGIIAPLVFMIIGGAPLGFLYKSINTMDSMIGYKNEKYINFGRFAAKLDDVVNYIPSRISAYIMIISSFLLRMNYKGSIKVYKRDRYNHASPNSAQTESVCAGALSIQLAGDAYYFGKLYKKPTIGDDLRPINKRDIVLSNKLMYATAIISLIIFVFIKLSIINLF